MRGDGLGCSFVSKTRSRSPISSRIAVLSLEARLRAFLWGIALPSCFALPEYIKRKAGNRSGK